MNEIVSALNEVDSPILHFDDDETSLSYDIWFRAKVQKALCSTELHLPHDKAMDEVREMLVNQRQNCIFSQLGWSNPRCEKAAVKWGN